MASGGIRKGSGPKKGSKNKPRFEKFVTEAQAKNLIKKALDMANKGDSIMLKFVFEQYFGKAPQSLTLEGNPEKPIPITKV